LRKPAAEPLLRGRVVRALHVHISDQPQSRAAYYYALMNPRAPPPWVISIRGSLSVSAMAPSEKFAVFAAGND